MGDLKKGRREPGRSRREGQPFQDDRRSHYGPKMTVRVVCSWHSKEAIMAGVEQVRGRTARDESGGRRGQCDRQRGALRPWQGLEQERHWRFRRSRVIQWK